MEHPAVVGHPQKEMTYFSLEEECKVGLKVAFQRYYSGKNVKDCKYVLAKHSTLIGHEENIKRLYEYNPDAKIVVCLRDPVSRAYSSYLMEVANGEKMPDFERLIIQAFVSEKENKPNWHYNVFIRLGQYVDYIELLFKYYKKEQVYFCSVEELKHNSQKELISILRWLDIEEKVTIQYDKKYNEISGVKYQWLSNFSKKLLQEERVLKKLGKKLIPLNKQYLLGEFIRRLNKKKIDKPAMSAEAKRILNEHYKPYNDKLKTLTAIQF